MTLAPSAGTSRMRWLTALDLVDVFVYVTVLNLAIEYLPGVIAESFTLSLLTAMLFKVVLELLILVKRPLKVRVRQSASMSGRIASVVLLVVVLAGSKLAILELTALIFGGRVVLGNFFAVTGLILVMLGVREVVRLLLGERREQSALSIT